jgi:hypothetical protein
VGSESIEVQADQLNRHAAAVDEIAEETGSARQAASTVQLDNRAYGVLCQLIPALLNPLSSAIVEVLNSTEEGLHDTTDRPGARRWESGKGPPNLSDRCRRQDL